MPRGRSYVSEEEVGTHSPVPTSPALEMPGIDQSATDALLRSIPRAPYDPAKASRAGDTPLDETLASLIDLEQLDLELDHGSVGSLVPPLPGPLGVSLVAASQLEEPTRCTASPISEDKKLPDNLCEGIATPRASSADVHSGAHGQDEDASNQQDSQPAMIVAAQQQHSILQEGASLLRPAIDDAAAKLQADKREARSRRLKRLVSSPKSETSATMVDAKIAACLFADLTGDGQGMREVGSIKDTMKIGAEDCMMPMSPVMMFPVPDAPEEHDHTSQDSRLRT